MGLPCSPGRRHAAKLNEYFHIVCGFRRPHCRLTATRLACGQDHPFTQPEPSSWAWLGIVISQGSSQFECASENGYTGLARFGIIRKIGNRIKPILD